MKLFPNFTSIPFDYLLISWVTNYTHNRGVLTCLSHRELLEHWNGLTAKVHIFLSEIMKKSCDKFLPRFDDFVFFVTDSKIHQTLNFYLKSTKANRLAKVIRVLSGKFTESCTTLLHRARLRRLHKYIQNTHSKLVLTKVNFGSKFVFKNWPLFHSKKCPNPLNYFSEFAVNHSISNWLAVQKFSLSHYHK